jgi:hypothetical protein
MATFAIGKGDFIRPWRNCSVRHYPVSVSQTIYRGYPVKLAGAGLENRVIVMADNDSAGIVGIAAHDIVTTSTHVPATDTVAVWLATPEAEFVGRTVADDAVDFTDTGVNVALEADATNLIWCVETDNVTQEIVRVLGYRNPITNNVQATEGDTNALCVFKFIPGASIHIPIILA